MSVEKRSSLAVVIAAAISLLALSTPGTRAVRASEDVALAAEGQTCEAANPTTAQVTVHFKLDRPARFPSETGEPQPGYALNNRGYSYSQGNAIREPDGSR